MDGTLDLKKLEMVADTLSRVDVEELAKTLDVANIAIMASQKMLKAEEVAAICGGVHKSQVDMWREMGILRGTKTGRSWVFSQEEVRAFQRKFRGENIANPTAIRKILAKEKGNQQAY